MDDGKKTVLAVDDVPFFLNRLKTMLKDTPYKLVCLTSGKVALDYIAENRPALFLLDIEMPEMDGYELARKIRENGHTAPIIYLTGNDSQEYLDKAMAAGASDFIVKTFGQLDIVEKIDKYIQP